MFHSLADMYSTPGGCESTRIFQQPYRRKTELFRRTDAADINAQNDHGYFIKCAYRLFSAKAVFRERIDNSQLTIKVSLRDE